MSWAVSNSFLMMEHSMDFLWTKQRTILDNLANVETPGYKTKYVTFEEALHARLQAASNGQRPAATIREAIASSRPTIHEAAGETARMDENGVNVAEQNVELARNAYQLQYVLDSINTDLSMLRSAIRGQ